MTSHTPGPWFVIDRVTSLDITLKEETATRQYPGSFIRVDPNHYIDVGISQARANARLIAASPRMYAYIVTRAEAGDVEAQAIIADLSNA